MISPNVLLLVFSLEGTGTVVVFNGSRLEKKEVYDLDPLPR